MTSTNADTLKEAITSHAYWETYSSTVAARQVVTEMLMMLTTRKKESPQQSLAMAEWPESIRSRYAKNDYVISKKSFRYDLTLQERSLTWIVAPIIPDSENAPHSASGYFSRSLFSPKSETALRYNENAPIIVCANNKTLKGGKKTWLSTWKYQSLYMTHQTKPT